MRKRGSRIGATAVAALAAGLLLAAPGVAQDAGAKPAGDKAADAVAPSTGTCTFDVIDQPIGDVLEYVRRAGSVNVVVAPEAAKETVTFAVRNMGWRSALEEIARMCGCTVEDVGEYLRVEKPPRVSFSFAQADISKVIQTIAALSGANIVADPDDVKGMVTVNLIDVPWKKALAAIVGSKGFQVVEEPGNILRVVSRTKLSVETETRVYQLRFLRPPPDYGPKLPSSEYVEKTGTRPQGNIDVTFNIITSLRAALMPEGGLQYVNASNSLVLTGTKPKLAQVERMLAALDREPLQIFVDLQFISTRNTDLFNVGIGPGEGGVQGSMTFASLENVVRLPFNVANGGWEDWVSTIENVPAMNTIPEPTFTGGSIDFSATSLLLKLFKKDVRSRITQSPKLFVLDNQEATIFVGESVRYAQSEASSSQSGTLEYSIKEADNSPVSTGFQLLLVPHVVPDTDKIMMTIVPSQKALTGSSSELAGFDKFSIGAAGAEQTIFLPREGTSTLVTTLICQHGVTTVLGGLMVDSDRETISKLPWLGDIPFLGWLFKIEERGKETSQVLIFMTPWLIKEPSHQREALREDLLSRDRGLDSEWRTMAKDLREKRAAEKGAPMPEKAPEKAPEKKK
jgi:type IV pilus assembly protein PilQ